MKINQTTFAIHLREACKVTAFKDDLNLKKASDGTYIYTAGPLANNHPGTKFARAYKKAYNVGVDKTRKLQIQTYASKALSKVRAEEDEAALAFVTPAANGNQGNGGNGAANVLPRFIILGALLAFICAALGSYSLRDSCVHLTVVEGSSNNAMYAGWWRNVSMSMKGDCHTASDDEVISGNKDNEDD
ncbi:hypothetical protein QTG54_011627 [Skeletonema marinoi]|uniref:Uncharacterized protein n=1 Tax=Skeletonema marinoi TaxID=267567 RepID=A0AAD8Y2Z3_9STRA|nr:hypothetical protein QTG54_011627 [Skeletonema marinoi]